MKKALLIFLAGMSLGLSWMWALDKLHYDDSKEIEITRPQSFEDRVRNEINSVDTKGIPTDYLLTIAELESGNGHGGLYTATRNLFSISTTLDANYPHSFYYGKKLYRFYKSDIESIQDVVRLLTTRKRYKLVYRMAVMDEHDRFMEELASSGFGKPDNRYGEKLKRVFREVKQKEVNKLIENNTHY